MQPQQPRRDYSTLIEQLLAPYGVWASGEGRWRSACPVHKGDNTTTFAINASGRWRCYKCSAWGDLARLIVHVKRITLKQAQDYVGSAPVPFRSMLDVPQLSPRLDRRHKLPYAVLREALIAPYRGNCPRYLLNRRFSEGSLRVFHIGYDLQRAKIVLPVRDWKARLVGLTYRLDFDSDRSQPAKYWHDNFEKSRHLYGFHLWAGRKIRRLHLVEGQLDAVRMYQLGYAATAIMGSELSLEQLDVLKTHCQAGQLVLAFDNDEAGAKATKDAVKKLSHTRYARGLMTLRYDTKDPGELDEMHKVEAIPWHRSCLLS